MGFFKRNRSGNQIVVACMTSNVLLVLWFTLQLLSHLKIAVRRRVEWQRIPAHKISPSERSSAPLGDEETPRVAILFSGGIDSMMIAAVAHLVLPIDVGIDLVNVAFENPRMSKAGTPAYNVPDRLTGVDGLEELKQLPDGYKHLVLLYVQEVLVVRRIPVLFGGGSDTVSVVQACACMEIHRG
eukprot:m.812906 g.812906  ORF g.812906 m.812906 type:complete len:184 (-) comp23390_c0_seq92:2833-3384(-)